MKSIRARVVIVAAALVLVAAACGSDDSADDTVAATTGAAAATTAAATTAAAATTSAPAEVAGPYGETPAPAGTIDVATTTLGDVLTSGGLTLYIFTPDEGAAAPTCVDQCATAWPPLAGGSTAGSGVDADELTEVTRADGSTQVAYYGWPLYFYAEDAAPGDVNGQGIGDKWYVIDAEGQPIGM